VNDDRLKANRPPGYVAQRRRAMTEGQGSRRKRRWKEEAKNREEIVETSHNKKESI